MRTLQIHAASIAPHERRRHRRCPANMRVIVVEVHGVPLCRGRVRNFSAGGCFIEIIGPEAVQMPEPGALVRVLWAEIEPQENRVGRIVQAKDAGAPPTGLHVRFEQESGPDWPRLCHRCPAACEECRSLADEPIIGALMRSVIGG